VREEEIPVGGDGRHSPRVWLRKLNTLRFIPKRRPTPLKPLTHLLKQLQNVLRATIDEALAPAGLSFPEAAVLSELSLVSRRSNAELARSAFVTPQSMVTLLKSLEARGLIVRRPSPEGGRAMPAELTPEGAKQLMVFRLAMREVEHRLQRNLTPIDRARLRELPECCLESLRSDQETAGHDKTSGQ
jgi:DNA-binding MarR family transcriptional regulator